MKTKSTWGGKREGSGRPRTEKTVTLSFRVKESEAKQIESQILKIINKSKKVNLLIAIVIIAYIVFISAVSANGQTKVVQTKDGNYTSATVTKKATGSKATETGKFFTDSKGNKYPVYKSVNGKLFYKKTSKSGNVYNVYLTEK